MRFDIRLIVASNVGLEELRESGKLREDLYYRLRLRVSLPPLRDRGPDIRRLTDMYLTAAAVSLGKPTLSLSAEVRELFERAPWRGNLRELETVCEVLTLTVPPPGPVASFGSGRAGVHPARTP